MAGRCLMEINLCACSIAGRFGGATPVRRPRRCCTCGARASAAAPQQHRPCSCHS